MFVCVCKVCGDFLDSFFTTTLMLNGQLSFLCLCYLCVLRQTVSIWFFSFLIYFITNLLFVINLIRGSQLAWHVRHTDPPVSVSTHLLLMLGWVLRCKLQTFDDIWRVTFTTASFSSFKKLISLIGVHINFSSTAQVQSAILYSYTIFWLMKITWNITYISDV